MSSISSSPPNSPSGFAILARSRIGKFICSLWEGVNGFLRPFFPLIHICLLVATGVILCAVVFANQHLPTWYDETCFTDPAFYKATQDVWRTRVEFDSLEIEPFAIKYPLLIWTFWGLAKVVGMNFACFRGLMLVLGLLPVAGLLWLSRKRELLQSWMEIIQATFFLACFGLFYWAIFIRPEAMLLSLGFFIVLFWLSEAVSPLFVSALCIPLCGLHWNAIVLPSLIAWLIWGGNSRKPLVVVGGAFLGTLSILLWYHLAGMWPSYLLEAHRFTSPNILENIRRFFYEIFLTVRFDRLLLGNAFPFNVFLCSLLVFGGGAIAIQFASQTGLKDRKTFLFFFLSLASVILALASAAWLNDHYSRLLVPLSCLLLPRLFRYWWKQYPLLLLFTALFAGAVASTLWNYTLNSKEGGSRTSIWMDEHALETALGTALTPEDTVLADTSAYFAIRSHCKEFFPLCYAFDLTSEQIHSCSAVLVEDNPSRLFHRDYSDYRKTSYSKGMQAFFCPDGTCSEDIWSFRVTPDELLSAIADHWNCSFTEVPLSFPASRFPGTIHFRLFRPIFPDMSSS